VKVFRPLEERSTPVRDCVFALALIAVVVTANACMFVLEQLKSFAAKLTKE
jgi:hypothetical protein